MTKPEAISIIEKEIKSLNNNISYLVDFKCYNVETALPLINKKEALELAITHIRRN